MKTPKKNTSKKSTPVAKKKSGLNNDKDMVNPPMLSDEDDDDFDLPMNDLDLDGLDPLDEDDDF
ncbi:MAG: hypothetical protein ACKOW2_00050 [Sphingobacteriaceae bacterium]